MYMYELYDYGTLKPNDDIMQVSSLHFIISLILLYLSKRGILTNLLNHNNFAA